jgi:endonuclease/exonuclease/phosphatase (EEP) superfamily protein YafD
VDSWQGKAGAVAGALGWVFAAIVGLAVLLALAGETLHPLHAAVQGVTPALAVLALAVVVLAASTRRWALLAVGVVVVVAQVATVAPAVLARRAVPGWARGVAPVSIAVANVRWDNPDPAENARQLLATDADVLVVIELSTTFAATLDHLGARRRYPYRLLAAHRHGAGGIGLYSSRPLHGARQVRMGPRAVPVATVRASGRALEIVGIHAAAPTTRGRLDEWEAELDALDRHARAAREPAVLAGDFNATRWHPAFAQLLDETTDVHEAAGKPFSRSWPADGPVLGLVPPLTRLDHALVTDGVAVLGVADLAGRGSDHRGFVVTLAVRPPRSPAPG